MSSFRVEDLEGDTDQPALTRQPRHASWFKPEAEQLLADREVSRVVADPATVP